MKSSIAIKSILASFLNSLGVISWKLTNYTGNNFVFLMYHRVIPKDKAEYVEAGMYVEPETFEIHLRFLKKYFTIVPISELSFVAKNNSCNEGKPLCILTFDDGWYDFYEYAFPSLKKYQIPATVFLPTDFIGTKKWFWTDRLSKLFFQRYEVRLLRFARNDERAGAYNDKSEGVVNQLENLKGSQESQLEKAIQILKTCRDEDIEDILTELSIRWGVNPDMPERAFLSWEEVKEMAQSGLISFGSHTASHRILTTLTDGEIQDELIRSKEKLIAEKVVDPTFIPFSYPNGNYNEKIVRMVKDAGYSLAVTTENGWNRPQSDPFSLRRIAVHQDITSTEAMLGCRIIGIF
jgi:peptidoglycan/xylan/chitin deacetylase (PgdA/CDA1 family)